METTSQAPQAPSMERDPEVADTDYSSQARGHFLSIHENHAAASVAQQLVSSFVCGE